MKLLKTKGRICNVPAFFIYFQLVIINFQITLLSKISRCNKRLFLQCFSAPTIGRYFQIQPRSITFQEIVDGMKSQIETIRHRT